MSSILQSRSCDNWNMTSIQAIESLAMIEEAIASMQADRVVFMRFRDGALASAIVKQTYFLNYVARWYASSILQGVRRIVDGRRDTHSLKNVLEHMLRDPDGWVLERALRHSGRDGYSDADKAAFKEAIYGPLADLSGRRLDANRIAADLTTLIETTAVAKQIVDETIAHSSRSPESEYPLNTWIGLHQIIDRLEMIALPYVAISKVASAASLIPEEVNAWYQIFEPWKYLTESDLEPNV